MKISDMTELMKQMNRNGISLLELEEEGTRLRLERPLGSMQSSTDTHPTDERSNAAAAPGGGQPKAEDRPARQTAAATLEGQIVTAPVVGVFYAAPSPDGDPFVAVGSEIEVGTTVCIIEAMKLMNEVTSKYAGTVLDIMVQDGQRVEYGQPLMRIGDSPAATSHEQVRAAAQEQSS